LQLSPSGTYFNLSEGISDTVMNDLDLEVHADGSYVYNGSGIVTFTNTSTNATNYLWLFDDGATSTLENPVHVYPDGNYIVTLIAANGCDNDTTYLTISILTGVSEIEKSEISISPNPSNGKFNIKFSDAINGEAAVRIYKITGELVFKDENYLDVKNIVLKNISDGVYVLVVVSNGRNYVKKILIQN